MGRSTHGLAHWKPTVLGPLELIRQAALSDRLHDRSGYFMAHALSQLEKLIRQGPVRNGQGCPSWRGQSE